MYYESTGPDGRGYATYYLSSPAPGHYPNDHGVYSSAYSDPLYESWSAPLPGHNHAGNSPYSPSYPPVLDLYSTTPRAAHAAAYGSYGVAPLSPPASNRNAEAVYRGVPVDPRPDGFDDLRRAMDESPDRSGGGGGRYGGGGGGGQRSQPQHSTIFKIISFIKGIMPLKTTLQRPYTETRDSVMAELASLSSSDPGISYTDLGSGYLSIRKGDPRRRGQEDYVILKLQFITNGATAAPLPGADMWYTKVIITKSKGDGQMFRDIGKRVLNAARYEVRGAVSYDYEITTWGLY